MSEINLFELLDIMSCLRQHLKSTELPKEPFVITIWYSDIANKYLKSNTPSNSYAIYNKNINKYTHPDIIKKAKDIWNSELVPIEVIQMEYGLFYALPKKAIFEKNIKNMLLLEAEESIPKLNDFY